MGVWFSFFLTVALVVVALLGAGVLKLGYLFGVVVPYVAFVLFVVGFVLRVLKWGRSAVPYRIPTTCGQQKSLDWIKHSRLESPFTALEVAARMALEVLAFRSLFRNLRTELREGRPVYASSKWLWMAALAFHWSFFVILFRHLRFFTQEVPGSIRAVERLDAFFQIGVPLLYMTDVLILLALSYLFVRRIVIPQLRYISLPADYFPLFLILGIAITGVLMRYFLRVDVTSIKELAMSLMRLEPQVPQGLSPLFFAHLFLVSVLWAYFPFSKLMHMGGVFMSPTRNLANNSRAKRHVNPWEYPVKVHTYEQYEEEFRDKMKQAGIPVEKE
jgi:nitrate reductase gamma subunit